MIMVGGAIFFCFFFFFWGGSWWLLVILQTICTLLEAKEPKKECQKKNEKNGPPLENVDTS